MELVLVIIPCILVMAVLAWFVNRMLDEDRIKSYLRQRNGTLRECRPLSLGRGWWVEGNERLYEVRYLDEDGHEHQATAKIRWFMGVYWTDDKFVHYADQVPGKDSLEEENRRLREEVNRLKAQKKDSA